MKMLHSQGEHCNVTHAQSQVQMVLRLLRVIGNLQSTALKWMLIKK